MEAERQSSANQLEDDDEWMDWETRKESIPIFKHVVAGMLFSYITSFNSKLNKQWEYSTFQSLITKINWRVNLQRIKLFNLLIMISHVYRVLRRYSRTLWNVPNRHYQGKEISFMNF